MTDPDVAAEALLRLRGLAKTFAVTRSGNGRRWLRGPHVQLTAVDGVTLDLYRGETLALVGESGCGKSTLARMVVGLSTPTRGSVTFDGTPLYGEGASGDKAALRRARASMQMIFQDPYSSLNPRWRVRDIVGEPIGAAEPGIVRAARDARVRALFELVGLVAADLDRYPHQFSGGQRQRVSIARALSTHPALVVCDEPTSALDVSVQAQVLNLMHDLQQRLGLAYLFISHNLAVVRHIADRVAVMYMGRIVESADKRSLFAGARHPYTQMLLDAVPDLQQAGQPHADGVAQLAAAPSREVPDPLVAPRGCGFHPRCPHAAARCRHEAPPLTLVDSGHVVACHAVAENRIGAWFARTAGVPVE